MSSASGNGQDLKTQVRVIFTGSLGNPVAGYDCYTYAAFARYFARAFSPDSNPVVPPTYAAIGLTFGFLCAPSGLAVWPAGRPPRTPQNAEAVRVTEVFWLADDYTAGHLREYWRRRARLAGVSRARSKGESRRRIRGPRAQFLSPTQNHLAGGCLSQGCRLAGLTPKPEIHAG